MAFGRKINPYEKELPGCILSHRPNIKLDHASEYYRHREDCAIEARPVVRRAVFADLPNCQFPLAVFIDTRMSKMRTSLIQNSAQRIADSLVHGAGACSDSVICSDLRHSAAAGRMAARARSITRRLSTARRAQNTKVRQALSRMAQALQYEGAGQSSRRLTNQRDSLRQRYGRVVEEEVHGFLLPA